MSEQSKPGLDQEQQQQTGTNETIAEDFETGVLAQLDSLYRTARRMTNNQQ
jgi:hypothetical protein